MSTAHPNPESRVGAVLAGKYELVELIGKGGAGFVYAAVQHPLQRSVAVKMLRHDLSEEGHKELSSRFLREAAVTARLSHPNLVTVYDFGTTDVGERFVVMELLRGRTFKTFMNSPRVDAREVVRIAISVLKGLRHAHSHGLVHRDIKPSNIFLVLDDDGVEQPKILDFGLVKGGDSEMTRSGAYMGTPTYVAPEQARGRLDVDHRADQYALGVVLYRALCGQVPFRAEGPMATAIAHINEPYPPMSERAPGSRVDPALEAIVRRAMEKNPGKRFASVTEMARALGDWAGNSVSISSIALGGYLEPDPTAEAPVPGGRRVGGLILAASAVVASALLASVACLGVMTLPGDPVEEHASLSETLERTRPAEPAVELRGGALTDELLGELGSVPPAPGPEPAPAAPEPAERPRVVKAEPKPMVIVKPAPAPVRVAAPVVKPIPAPAPAPAPKPVLSKAVTVDGVSFDAAHAGRAVTWLNSADEAAVRAAGVYGRGVGIVMSQRPFASIEAFGATPYVGEKTVQAVADATR